jgi:hypothetical protein
LRTNLMPSTTGSRSSPGYRCPHRNSGS